jgi:hypothetical protein
LIIVENSNKKEMFWVFNLQKNLRYSCNCVMEYILEIANSGYINVYFLVIALVGLVNFAGTPGGQNLCRKN